MSCSIRTIGIVGAGVMGRSIGLCAARSGIDVRLYDVRAEASQAALGWIADQLAEDAKPVQSVAGLNELSDCDLLIEAVVENRSVKRRLLSALSAVDSEALIATNTSSLSIGELSRHVERPERFCGLHFCHPIAMCPLVEIVPGPETALSALDRGERLARQLGLQPLRTRDVPGFAVNRLLFPYLEASVALVRGGVDWQRIEQVAVEFGMRLGPLAQMDEIGIDVILRAAAAFHRGNPVVPPQSELLLAMFQAGRLGRKAGRGFYEYTGAGDSGLDRAAENLAAAHRTAPVHCTDAELQLRLFLPVVAAACALIQSEIVADAGDVQAALIAGLGCRGQAGDLADWVRRMTPPRLLESMQQLGLPAPETSAIKRLLAE